jgi:A/G-specific adenine glycosylase
VLRQLEEHPQVKRLGARVWYYALMDYGAMLKTQNISHNAKVKGYTKQTPYKGSTRELRAKLLFAIAEKRPLGEDARNAVILAQLEKEGYIAKKGKTYQIS